MKRAYGLILLCIFTLPLFAQDDEDDVERELPEIEENAEKYLDDGIKYDAENQVLFGVSGLIGGYGELHYQRKINQAFAVDIHGSMRLYKGIDLVEGLLSDYGVNADQDTGYNAGMGFGASLRFNPGRRAITQRGYYSINYRNRTEQYSTFTYSRQDFYYATGWHLIKRGNLGLELNQGIGMRLASVKYDDPRIEAVSEPNFFYMIDFRIGYYF